MRLRAFVSTGRAIGPLNFDISSVAQIVAIQGLFAETWRPGMPKSVLEFFKVAWG